MRFLVIADHSSQKEFSEKFKTFENIQFYTNYDFDFNRLNEVDVVFDFLIGENQAMLKVYAGFPDLIIFLNSVKSSLTEMMFASGVYLTQKTFGFNGIHGMFLRTLLEVSLYEEAGRALLKETMAALGTGYVVVSDRVGMVSPRILCMVINEAFYTLQEKTAEIEDIDQGMLLGTNYPYGPFEWVDKIGVKNVYKVLEAVYEDTKDERYKICPLLKTRYLKDF